ncbi:MAG: aldehyde ferredoxin oxidoreductase N-terminal domain-containing protein, partial [Planctomycetota bacterium]
MSGYCGKFLRINLKSGAIKKEDLNMEFAKKFIGGRGLGSFILSQEVPPNIDAFSPENKIIIATGPLTGTQAPASGRHMVITKSPLTGTIACSNSGGFWAAELKKAGYDMIILEEMSEKPCYIFVSDDTVEIRNAENYWGKLVSETTEGLLDEVGDAKARVMTIGPAGENKALVAAVMNDKYRAAGRSGVGAVMGS